MRALPSLFFFVATLLALASPASAQFFSCDGTTQTEEYNEFLTRQVTGLYDLAPLAIQPDPNDPIVVPLVFHSLEGVGAPPFLLSDAVQMVSVANAAFDGTGIEFKLPDLPGVPLTSETSILTNLQQFDWVWLILNLYQTRDAIDVYLINSLETPFGFFGGFGTYSFCSQGQGIIVRKGSTPNGIFYGGQQNDIAPWIHELGHYFDLIHPREEWEDPPGSGIAASNYAAECPGDPPFNWSIAGDFVADTLAEPDPFAYPFSLYNNCDYAYDNNPNVVTTAQSACPNTPYFDVIDVPGQPGRMVRNFMAGSPPECRDQFTPGQKARMFAALINFRPELYDACRGGSPNLLACDPAAVTAANANGLAGTSSAISSFTDESGIGAMVGAPGDEEVHTFEGTSAVNLAFEQTLTPNDGIGGRFGQALSFDGNTLLVGAPDAGDGRGQVSVYVRENGGYQLRQVIDPPSATIQDFGVSVDLYGEWLVVGGNDKMRPFGSPQDDRVFVFRHDPTLGFDDFNSWDDANPITLSQPSPGPTDYFGGKVAISGQYIAVGAWNGSTASQGAVYVYELVNDAWGAAYELPVSASHESFGWDVDIWGDTILVGAPLANEVSGIGGSIYFFQKEGSGWVETQRIDNPDVNVDGQFGYSVALASNSAIVGDPAYFGGLGLAYELVRTPYRLWVDVSSTLSTFGIMPLEFQFGQAFGSSVASTGDQFLIGANLLDRDLDVDVGGVYALNHKALTSGTMTSDVTEINAARGGVATMTVDFGSAAAGAIYLVAGSTSAPFPGQDISSLNVSPFESVEHTAFHTVLSNDKYFRKTTGSGSPRLDQEFGTLDSQGRATVIFNWPRGKIRPISPIVYTHTAALVDDLHYETTAVSISVQ